VFGAVAACLERPPTAARRSRGGRPAARAGGDDRLSRSSARAEDQRRAGDLPREAQSDHDPVVRRAAARALARILDPDDAPLLARSETMTPRRQRGEARPRGVVQGREGAHVRDSRRPRGVARSGVRAAGSIDPFATLVRAIAAAGRIRRAGASRVLRPGGRVAEAAAYAVGDVPRARGCRSSRAGRSSGLSRLAAPARLSTRSAAARASSRKDLCAPGWPRRGRPSDGRAERIFAVRPSVEPGSRMRRRPHPGLSSGDFTPAERSRRARPGATAQGGGRRASPLRSTRIAGDAAALETALTGDRLLGILAALARRATMRRRGSRAPSGRWCGSSRAGRARPVVRRASALRSPLRRSSRADGGLRGPARLRSRRRGGRERARHRVARPADRSCTARRAAWLELTGARTCAFTRPRSGRSPGTPSSATR